MGLAAFNRVRREQAALKEVEAKLAAEAKLVKEAEAEGLDPQLMALTKKQLDDYAEKEFGVSLDSRQKKEVLVREVMALEATLDDDGLEIVVETEEAT